MSVRVERVDLPGIGVRTDVITESGRRVSVVSQRSGERDLALFDVDDPDASTDTVALSDDEAAAIAELLGASIAISRLSSLSDKVPGLFTEEISLPFDSKFIGRPMGDTKARTVTSSSIVAIARGTEIIPSPTPGEIFERGDVIIAVGTRKGLDLLGKIIDKGPS
ncbi:MAG: potassium transporter TrkA [Micrococcales bacterium 70-64]|nr:cation:proton antiporter regulatory subunit [Leifsonia sp.]ODU64847.1 MAG: potassium transporter TrkA [Leifsonia sp. SCN 70-46]OJX86539.1 MAG: potassium transporter TrkA [Micrococcales bacterium 70-64]